MNKYKKIIRNSFEKDGYKILLPNIDYENISICLVDIESARQTNCKIKNSPIFYYIAKGEGVFYIEDEMITVQESDLIEIPSSKKYTYKGNMKMLEIIPNNFDKLEVEEELLTK